MNFQNLQSVETANWYIDNAFKAGNKLANKQFEMSKFHKPTDMNRIEAERLFAMSDFLKEHFEKIIHGFPNFDNLADFYRELSKLHFDIDEVKKALAKLQWCVMQVKKLAKEYAGKVKRSDSPAQSKSIKTMFFGRMASVIKHIKNELLVLEHARHIMKEFPHIKTDCFTVCIAGFPSVGKSTLLSQVTSAKPKIAAYEFTTLQPNMGYVTLRHESVQFIDIPGTLHREKMNPVEEQAHLALKYLADVVVAVVDPTWSYPEEIQRKLLASLKEYDKDFIIYLSKTDLLDPSTIAETMVKFPGAISNPEVLKKAITVHIHKK